jgi:hypothetical protein
LLILLNELVSRDFLAGCSLVIGFLAVIKLGKANKNIFEEVFAEHV